jgi:peroxiredoxin
MKTSTKPIAAPDFEATSSEGEAVRLSDFRGKKHVVLVFNRGFG